MNIFTLEKLLNTQVDNLKYYLSRVYYKNCYIFTFFKNNKNYAVLQSYARIVAIYNYDNNNMLVECDNLINNRARKAYSTTTTKHINTFIEIIKNEINKNINISNIIDFDYYYNCERDRLIDKI